MKFLKRLYLKYHGWYQGWSNEDWLKKGKEYNNPDWAGLDTEEAYKISKKCPYCDGKGRIYGMCDSWTCNECKGKGQI